MNVKATEAVNSHPLGEALEIDGVEPELTYPEITNRKMEREAAGDPSGTNAAARNCGSDRKFKAWRWNRSSSSQFIQDA